MSDQRRRKQRLGGLLVVALAMVLAGCAGGSDSNPREAPAATATTTQPSDSTASPDADDMTNGDFVLPSRPGSKPSVTSGTPHIQLDQTSSEEMYKELATWAFSLEGVVELPSRASLPGARALTVDPELTAHPDAMIVGREFAHIHPLGSGGGSLHLRLPADSATEMVDKGWGEWHPFALDGTLPNLVMVYAPRDADDLDVVKSIIEASVRHATSSVDGA